MEFCPYKLDAILDAKMDIFAQHIEFTDLDFILSCEIFIEIVECIDYLHNYEKKYLITPDIVGNMQCFISLNL